MTNFWKKLKIKRKSENLEKKKIIKDDKFDQTIGLNSFKKLNGTILDEANDEVLASNLENSNDSLPTSENNFEEKIDSLKSDILYDTIISQHVNKKISPTWSTVANLSNQEKSEKSIIDLIDSTIKGKDVDLLNSKVLNTIDEDEISYKKLVPQSDSEICQFDIDSRNEKLIGKNPDQTTETDLTSKWYRSESIPDTIQIDKTKSNAYNDYAESHIYENMLQAYESNGNFTDITNPINIGSDFNEKTKSDNNLIEKTKTNNLFTCEFCNMVCRNYTGLVNHKRLNKACSIIQIQQKYKCQKCDL